MTSLRLPCLHVKQMLVLRVPLVSTTLSRTYLPSPLPQPSLLSIPGRISTVRSPSASNLPLVGTDTSPLLIMVWVGGTLIQAIMCKGISFRWVLVATTIPCVNARGSPLLLPTLPAQVPRAPTTRTVKLTMFPREEGKQATMIQITCLLLLSACVPSYSLLARHSVVMFSLGFGKVFHSLKPSVQNHPS